MVETEEVDHPRTLPDDRTEAPRFDFVEEADDVPLLIQVGGIESQGHAQCVDSLARSDHQRKAIGEGSAPD